MGDKIEIKNPLTPSNQNVKKIKTATSTTPNTTNSTNLLRTLAGKSVFLDVNSSYKNLHILKECLITIGVTLADCMSKDVDYVITNRVKYEELTANTNQSPAVNTELSRKSSIRALKTSPTLSQFSSRLNAINRTQTILEKASKGHVCSDILTNARRLGINILHIYEIEKYVEKYMTKMKLINTNKNDNQNIQNDSADMNSECVSESTNNYRVRKLKSPYLKFESVCKQYKPIFFEFEKWHHLVLDKTKLSNHSPFQIYFSDEVKDSNNTSTISNKNEDMKSTDKQSTQLTYDNKTSSHLQLHQSQQAKPSINIQQIKNTLIQRTTSMLTPTTNCNNALRLIQTPNTITNPQQKRKQNGYCECCKQRYDNLKQHLTSTQHETYEKNLNNFKDIDFFIQNSLNFEKFLSKYEKPKVEEIKTVEILQEPIEETDVTDYTNNSELDTNMTTTSESNSTMNNGNKPKKMMKLIDRLIFESKSLGELKSSKSRRSSTSICKYTDISVKDFNSILTSATNRQVSSDEQKLIKKRKRTTIVPQTNTSEINEIKTAKVPLKIKLEKNKSNNNWQISSSSIDPTQSQIDLERHFENALFQLAEVNEDNEEVKKQQQQQQDMELPNSQSTETPQQCKKPKINTPIETKETNIVIETSTVMTMETTEIKTKTSKIVKRKKSCSHQSKPSQKSVKPQQHEHQESLKIEEKQETQTNTFGFSKSPIFKMNEAKAKDLTLNYINGQASPPPLQQPIIQQPQQQQHNYCYYMAPHPPLPPMYYNQQFLHPSNIILQPPPLIQHQQIHQQQQQQQSNNQKRVSLNSSTGNLFDTLSAANSLINNF